jgi:hypothetical protein
MCSPRPEEATETVGELYDRLPPDEWVTAYGHRIKRAGSALIHPAMVRRIIEDAALAEALVECADRIGREMDHVDPDGAAA